MCEISFPGFESLRRLGRGGYGAVYLARSSDDPGVLRALKTVKISDDQDSAIFRAALKKEARLIQFEHPSLCRIFEYRESQQADGRVLPWLILEYCQRGSLADLLDNDAFLPTQEEILDVAMQLAHGLEFLHKNGIIHRDIKPGNILFDADKRAKLADFGIVKQAAQSATQTPTGIIVGTRGFIPPEKLLAPEQADRASRDVFALGVVLYELITGIHPFYTNGVSPFAIRRSVLAGPPKTNAIDGWGIRHLINDCLSPEAKRIPDGKTLVREVAMAQSVVDSFPEEDSAEPNGADIQRASVNSLFTLKLSPAAGLLTLRDTSGRFEGQTLRLTHGTQSMRVAICEGPILRGTYAEEFQAHSRLTFNELAAIHLDAHIS